MRFINSNREQLTKIRFAIVAFHLFVAFQDKMNTNPKFSRIRGFDGLRGLAVIAVFLEHKVISGYGLGGVGVWLFFALSGFLIIRILHNQRTSVESGISTVRQEMLTFWKRRALRIFPLYYLLLALITLHLLIGGKDLVAAGLPWYAAYLSNFYIGYIAHAWSSFSHLWSLSVEQQFYLVAAPMFLFFPLLVHQRLLLAMMSAAVVGLFVTAWKANDLITLYISPLPNFGFMAIGGMLALSDKNPAWSGTQWNMLLLLGLAAVLGVVGLESRFAHPGAAVMIIKFTLAYIFTFTVIAYISNRQDSTLTSLLDAKGLVYIGTISYGFYIFHIFSPSYDFVARLLPIPEVLRGFWFLPQLLMTISIASLSWHLLEKPILRSKSGHSKPSASQTDVHKASNTPMQ